MIDIHSHILPQIDDGARSLEEALEMAKIAAADGIEQMVATPHMFNGLSHNPEPSEIVERVAALQEAIGSSLKLLPGNEVHLTHEIAAQAANNRVTKLNQQNYMLVEFPSLNVPVGVEELFYQLQVKGVRPILVHPERNVELQAHPERVAAFVERGVLVQVTGMSVTGEFGPAAKAAADALLKHHCVHFLATDTHRPHRRPPILSKGRDAAAVIIGADRARRLVFENPLAAVRGESFELGPLIPFTPEKRKGWRSYLCLL